MVFNNHTLFFMIRTQVYLPKPLYQRIDAVARKDRKPKAQLIRELLGQGLAKRKTETIGQGLQSLARLGRELKARGPADLSSNIDHYLYDD